VLCAINVDIDTDVSSLYSLNSEGGGDVFDYDDEEDDEEEDDEPKSIFFLNLPQVFFYVSMGTKYLIFCFRKKYPGIVEGLAGLAGPHWSNTLTKTLMVNTTATTTTEVVNEKVVVAMQQPPPIPLEEEVITTATAVLRPKKSSILQGSCSEYDLTSIQQNSQVMMKRSSSYERLPRFGGGGGAGTAAKRSGRREVKTTRDEIWALILEKEKSRYLEERNSFFESEGKVLRKEQFMAIHGEEIFINGSSSPGNKQQQQRRMSEVSPHHHHRCHGYL